MDKSHPIIILGAGGLAREIYWYLKDIGYNQISFYEGIDLNLKQLKMGKEVCSVYNSLEIYSKIIDKNNAYFILGVGTIDLRILIVQEAIAAGLMPMPTVIHPSALIVGKDNNLGLGGVIGPGVILTTNINLDNYVFLNCKSCIGHDTKIGTYSVINSNSNISGNVSIGDKCFLGVGSSVIQNLSICSNTVIGAGTIIFQNIKSSGTYLGNPGKKII